MKVRKIKHLELLSMFEKNRLGVNGKQVVKLLERKQEDDFFAVEVNHEQSVVVLGKINQDIAAFDKNLQYSAVPLGVIISGKVIVFENGKAVRHLLPGDTIGLFETAHYLKFLDNKKLGNWTLIVEGDTEVVFLGESIFDIQNLRKTRKDSLENLVVNMSKEDSVPKPLTDLPLLDSFADLKRLKLQDETLVVMHTHLLETSYPLFRHISSVVNYSNMFLLEKDYSTIPKIYEKIIAMGVDVVPINKRQGLPYLLNLQYSLEHLWSNVLTRTKNIKVKKIIIMDDGGELLTSVPWDMLKDIEVVGVEQTTKGIYKLNETLSNFPMTISVAGSALKKEIESKYIADAVFVELDKFLEKNNKIKINKIGVVGAGNIGRNIIEYFEKNYQVNYYDFSRYVATEGRFFEGKGRVPSISQIFEENDLIIGTTGRDFMKGVILNNVTGHKYVVSASSSDVEFYSILNRNKFQNIYEDFEIQIHEHLKVTVLNGGYPINFNRREEVEKPQNISITRCLLYAGFVQAINLKPNNIKNRVIRLDVMSQRDILDSWISLKKDLGEEFYVLTTKEIERLSEGESFQEVDYKSNYALHVTTSPYIEMAKKHKEKYNVNVFGKDIVVYPNVMTPKYDWAGVFGVETLPNVLGKEVLELGVANGIISIFAGLRGAKKVDAVDINPHAIKNANENFKKFKLKNCKAFKSDLFENVKQKYDLVIFNLPYHGNKPRDILEHGVADENYKVAKKFIKQLPKYMKDSGLADVGFSTSGDTPLILSLFKKSKLEIIEKYSDERYGYNCDVYILKKQSKNKKTL